jgi:hypothetical protein
MTEAAVRQSFVRQAGWCHKLGSPFTALLMEVLAARLDTTTEVGCRILTWTGDTGPAGDIVPLRLAGALHALVLRGASPALAALYPPHPLPTADVLWPALSRVLETQQDAIQPFLDNAPQTNEVGRAGPLMVGLMTIAREARLPIALYEVGASAGLNLNLDKFSYDLGGVPAGDPTSGVRIAPEWTGDPPLGGGVRIVSCQGVDLAPLSAESPADRENLTAFVWADQTERLARLKAALEIALAHPVRVDQGDAADWIAQVLSPEPVAAVTRVLYHTVAFQYFPPATQARLREHIRQVGSRATVAGPFAWLRYEGDPEFDGAMSLRLTLWPSGKERALGIGHAHGASFKKL